MELDAKQCKVRNKYCRYERGLQMVHLHMRECVSVCVCEVKERVRDRYILMCLLSCMYVCVCMFSYMCA